MKDDKCYLTLNFSVRDEFGVACLCVLEEHNIEYICSIWGDCHHSAVNHMGMWVHSCKISNFSWDVGSPAFTFFMNTLHFKMLAIQIIVEMLYSTYRLTKVKWCGIGKQMFSYCWRDHELKRHPWRAFWQCLLTINCIQMHIVSDSATLPVDIYPTKWFVHKDIHCSTYIVVKYWKHPKYPSKGTW